MVKTAPKTQKRWSGQKWSNGPTTLLASFADQFPDQMYHIPDAEQVRAVCDTYGAIPADLWRIVLAGPAQQAQVREEGWILGVDLPQRLAA